MKKIVAILAIILLLILAEGTPTLEAVEEHPKTHEAEIIEEGHEPYRNSHGPAEVREPKEYGAPAAYFLFTALILLTLAVGTHNYKKTSDLARKIPSFIAATIYIFSLMVAAHYIVGPWSIVLLPLLLLGLWRLWPQL